MAMFMGEPLKPILYVIPVCPKCGKKLTEVDGQTILCPQCGFSFSKRDISYRYVWTEDHVP